MNPHGVVPCPCCGKPLYGVYGPQSTVLEGSQPVRADKDGRFLKCVHCKRRIAMSRDPKFPHPEYFVSPVQKCDQVLS
jgi:hypothetical protein